MIGSMFFVGFLTLAASANLSFLDNGVIKVGVDLDMGGVITYLSRSSDSVNVINSHDLGREVNQSYYSGPNGYGHSTDPGFPNWPWNANSAGDEYGNRGRVVAWSNDGSTIYVRAIPMQWALQDVPVECYMESWIRLDGDAVHLQFRLTNHRSDLTNYGAYSQELPAVYTIGQLWRLFLYDGDAPFTGAPAREVPYEMGPPWRSFSPSENWMALLDDSGWGLGVFNAEVYSFVAGFSDTPDTGGPSDNSTGYIAPAAPEVIDHNITYDYEAALILGTLADIRAYAAAHRRAEARPDVRFEADRSHENRQHVSFINATDDGLPFTGELRVRLDQIDPQIWLPQGRWDAATMPVVYVTAAFHTHDAEANVFWTVPGESTDESQRLSFPVVPDGRLRTYAVPLSSSPTYTGVITGLRLDPSDGGHPDDFVTIESVSFRPPATPPQTRVVARPIASSSRARAAASPGEKSALANLTYLDNGVIRVGVDLDEGGVITYLSKSSDSRNVINDHDLGRQVQQSYYSGPSAYGGVDWPWNPIGAGDGYGNPSEVVSSVNDGTTIYVRVIPKQWDLPSVPAECYFETWVSLDGNAVELRYRLTNHRSDLTRYDAFDQELPAVYTIGTLYRLFSYEGAAPFTGAPVREISPAQGPNWDTFYPTEHWMAFVDDSGWGLGVVNPAVRRFLAGFAGIPNSGGPKDDATGYIAPVRQEILDHNITYDHDVALILGTLDDTRSYAAAHRPAEARPDIRFDRDPIQEDREHVLYQNATDAGLPLTGALRVGLEQTDPQIWFYEGRFDAASMPILYLTAAFHTHETQAEVFWVIPGESFDPSRRVAFPVIPDGAFRTYAIDLSSAPTYTGVITQLRLDPSTGGGPGDYVEIRSISFRPPGNGLTHVVMR